MTAIVFLVEEAPEGGFTARALGTSILTDADTLAALCESARDAVACHYDPADRPGRGRVSESPGEECNHLWANP